MGKFNFDIKGNITPYELHPISVEDLDNEFVVPFADSVTRAKIVEGHNNYIIELFQILENNFFQWLDGSFVTQKLNPNDIDIINFVHFTDATNEKAIYLKKFLTGHGDPKTDFFVDGYIVPVYPPSDPRFTITQDRYNYWRVLFGKDRNNNPKGMLELQLIKK